MSSVSIAIATYNGAKHIDEQLRSLSAQSLAPAEVVVTDDGSQDGTLERVGDFAKTAPFPVRVYENEGRLGYRANFMRAASLCQSDLIAFCDQDDIWEPQKIEVCVECFRNPDVLLTYHNALAITEDGRELGRLDWRAAPAAVNPRMTIGPWLISMGFSQMFRRSMPTLPELWRTSRELFDPDQPMAHDRWFFFLASVLGSIAYLHEPLVRYRQHGGNLYGWRGDRYILQGNKYISGLKRSFSTNGAHDSAPVESACRLRADILDAAQGELGAPWRERATAAAARYRGLETQLAARRRLYTTPEFAQRLRAFLDLAGSGGYDRNDKWSFGFNSLAKDASLGVCLGHRLARP